MARSRQYLAGHKCFTCNKVRRDFFFACPRCPAGRKCPQASFIARPQGSGRPSVRRSIIWSRARDIPYTCACSLENLDSRAREFFCFPYCIRGRSCRTRTRAARFYQIKIHLSDMARGNTGFERLFYTPNYHKFILPTTL